MKTKMKYFERIVSHRESINRFGKIGYPKYCEFFKTDDVKKIENFQKGKKIKFYESDFAKKKLKHLEKNKIYSEKMQK